MTPDRSDLPRVWRRHALLVAAALAAGSLAVVSLATGALSGLERQSVDARFGIRGAESPPSSVVIVAVDQRTLTAAGVRPPIPRIYYARLLDRIRAGRPRAIALDVQLSGRTDPRDDGALVTAITRDGPVVLATHESGAGPVPVPAGIPNLGGAVPASAAVDTDPDGVLRRMLYAQITLKTLAVRAAELFRGRPESRPDFPGNHAWVDFRGPPGTYPTYSAVDVLSDRVPSRTFSGKAVLVGVTDPVEKDVFTTAASADPMSGVEFHANALSTILNGFPLTPAGGIVDIAVLFLLAAIPAAMLSIRLSAIHMLAAALGTLLLFLVVVQLAFDAGTIAPVANPILALALGVVGAMAADSFVQREQLRNLQRMFDLLPSPVSDFFVSYRREQSELAANTLRDGLVRKFGAGSVFMDEDAIDPGEQWPRRIEEAIGACRAMLVVIGPNWLDARAADGSRRLDDARDWVRREIEMGLSRADIAVVPVLHDGAQAPGGDGLPDPLKPLANCQAVQLTGRQLDRWIDELAQSIQSGRVRAAWRLQQSADST